jgi:hypothetical protein
MRRRLAGPVGLVTAAAVFVGVFLITHSLVWPPLLALGAALGVYLMLDDRSGRQVASDDYAADAREKVAEAMRRIGRIRNLSRSVTAPAAQEALRAACQHVPELFERVQARSPNSLYSTASQIGGHLASLEAAVGQYLDIQRNPVLYPDAEALKRSGEAAFQRFAAFALESVRLVNQGDLAQYWANLDTVAPPELPELR